MKVRKKPVIVDAIRWLGENPVEIIQFVGQDKLLYDKDRKSFFIRTLEGSMEARLGDWIIRGVQGEFYPCKPEIFEETYEIAYEAGS